MLTALIVFASLQVIAGAVALTWFLARKRPAEPTRLPVVAPVEPSAPPAEPPEPGQRQRFVRLADYDADLAALTRRIESVETDLTAKHAQLTGMIGSLKRGNRDEEKAALREQVMAEIRGASEQQPQQVQPIPGVRQVILKRG